jgi:hypothetical protein
VAGCIHLANRTPRGSCRATPGPRAVRPLDALVELTDDRNGLGLWHVWAQIDQGLHARLVDAAWSHGKHWSDGGPGRFSVMLRPRGHRPVVDRREGAF